MFLVKYNETNRLKKCNENKIYKIMNMFINYFGVFLITHCLILVASQNDKITLP